MKWFYSLNRDEYLATSVFISRRKRAWMRAFHYVGLATIAIGVLTLIQQDAFTLRLAPIALVLTGAFWLFYPFYVSRDQRNDSWETFARAYASLSLEVDEAGIRLERDDLRTSYQWRAFNRWIESKHAFVLYRADSAGQLLIPTRVMNELEIDELRSLLNQSIHALAEGFPVVQKQVS